MRIIKFIITVLALYVAAVAFLYATARLLERLLTRDYSLLAAAQEESKATQAASKRIGTVQKILTPVYAAKSFLHADEVADVALDLADKAVEWKDTHLAKED